MRLLLVQGGGSATYDDDGNIYVLSNTTDPSIWERYRKYCDELVLMVKRNNWQYKKGEPHIGCDIFDKSLAEIVSAPDIHSPRRNIINLRLRAEAKRIISEEVRKADRVIVRSPGHWLADIALEMCRKHGKKYMIESIDFQSEMCWYGVKKLNRLFAPYIEMKTRREISRAPYVAYITQRVLQERYPTKGKSIGCSDVELPALDESVLESRIERTRNTPGKSPVIFGTVGFIGNYVKGQEYVIRAMSLLKSEGVNGIEYQLMSFGSTDYLGGIAESLGVSGQVRFMGTVPHDEIFAWYDSLDVYIQPSLTESQCRSVIEAMSRGCPAACSRVGGMQEYPDKEIMFTAKNVKEIAAVMRKLLDPEERIRQARKSFSIAGAFERPKLDAVRDKFYAEFMGTGKP